MFCALVGIQLHLKRNAKDPGFSREAIGRSFVVLSRTAIAGIVLTVVTGGWYWLASDGALRQAVWGKAGRMYFIGAMFFVLVEIILWVRVMIQVKSGAYPSKGVIAIIFASAVATIPCMSVARELIRLQSIDIDRLYRMHQYASKVGGFTIFMIFAAINIVVVIVCIRLARKAIKQGESRQMN